MEQGPLLVGPAPCWAGGTRCKTRRSQWLCQPFNGPFVPSCRLGVTVQQYSKLALHLVNLALLCPWPADEVALCRQGSEDGALFAASSDHTCSLPDTVAAHPAEKDVLDTSQPEEVLLDENKEAEEHEFYMVRHGTRAVLACLVLPSAVLWLGIASAACG